MKSKHHPKNQFGVGDDTYQRTKKTKKRLAEEKVRVSQHTRNVRREDRVRETTDGFIEIEESLFCFGRNSVEEIERENTWAVQSRTATYAPLSNSIKPKTNTGSLIFGPF